MFAMANWPFTFEKSTWFFFFQKCTLQYYVTSALATMKSYENMNKRDSRYLILLYYRR